MSSINKDNFTFPIWLLLISYYSFNALARTSNIMLNEGSESRHPGLVPGLRGKAFNFSPQSMMLGVGLVNNNVSLFIY